MCLFSLQRNGLKLTAEGQKKDVNIPPGRLKTRAVACVHRVLASPHSTIVVSLANHTLRYSFMHGEGVERLIHTTCGTREYVLEAITLFASTPTNRERRQI